MKFLKTDRKSFEEKWESLGLFVKYGMMTDDKFLEKANKFNLFEDADGGKFLYDGRIQKCHGNFAKKKEGKLVMLLHYRPGSAK